VAPSPGARRDPGDFPRFRKPATALLVGIGDRAYRRARRVLLDASERKWDLAPWAFHATLNSFALGAAALARVEVRPLTCRVLTNWGQRNKSVRRHVPVAIGTSPEATGKNDALIADVHTGTGHEFLTLLSALAAEGAMKVA
jgi:hypothetical protein